MNINGKSLAWALIHFSFFLSMIFGDIPKEMIMPGDFWRSLTNLVFYLTLFFFFGWRFIVNMEESF